MSVTGYESSSKFSQKSLNSLIQKCRELVHILAIDWDYDEDRDLWLLSLENEEVLEFTHSKSAHAWLDAFLQGYNKGFKDGRLQ